MNEIKSIRQIESLVQKMEQWGMLKDLTDNEREQIVYDLKHIAYCAALDAKTEMVNSVSKLLNKI